MDARQFDRVVNRMQSDSAQWDGAPAIFGTSDILPMWVADMDFEVAAPITEAIVKRAGHGVYGYTFEGDSLKQAVIDRLRTKFGWHVDRSWLVFSTGIVHALHMIIRAFTSPGDGVILQPPVYYPFFSAIRNNGCKVIENPLIERNATYGIDFAGLERAFKPDDSGLRPEPSRARLMLLCSPHNPVGRVWTREELERTARIVIDHDAVLVSDEIHAELLFCGHTHTATATLGEDIARRTITCFSPSKTFNLAGLKASVLIIPDPRIRAVFKERTAGFLSTPNVYGLTAMEAAFKHGDPWLRELRTYLEGNRSLLVEFCRTRLEPITVCPPQGTYLAWLDCRRLKLSDRELRAFMRRTAKVGLDDGYVFGSGGSGFQRLNFACPLSKLERALEQIESALKTL
jgi:cystathionine beta-lyase